MNGIALFLPFLAVVAAGCGTNSTDAESSDHSALPPPRASAPAGGGAMGAHRPAGTPQAAASACPATGRWAACSVEKRLSRAGLVARKIPEEGPERAGFSIRPQPYALGRGSRLELFIYPDERALARDLAKMDTIKAAPLGAAGSWSTAPVLIRSVNLAAVVLTRDAREADRLSLALTAGPPQRASR